MSIRMNTTMVAAFLTVTFLIGGLARAQEFPSKPIHILVPFAPGGAPDVVARLVGQSVGQQLGQSIVVENRPGANGVIATEMVAKAQPNGYTLLCTTGSHTINPSIYRKLPYDTLRDFAAVSRISSGGGWLLVVKNDFPAKNVKELVALAKRPDKPLHYGSSGNGNSLHLAGALLGAKAGVDLVHVPYKGGGSLTTALLGSEIEILFLTPIAAKPFVKSGQIRILGIGDAKRSPRLPDVPTIAEAGVPGYEYGAGWNGLFAPARTPRKVIDKLGEAVRKAIVDPSVRDKLLAMGADPIGNTPEEFDRFVRDDIQHNAQIVKTAKIELQ